jgi:hypothetical protein
MVSGFVDAYVENAGGGGGGGGNANATGLSTQVAVFDGAHSLVGYADLIYNPATKILSLDSAQFSLTPTSTTPAEGKLVWNSTDGTLNLGMPGGDVNLQIGQEMLVRVKNDEGSDLTNGTVVYFSGADGANVLVKKASAASAQLMGLRTIGMTTEPILSNQHGYITITGNVHGVDTHLITAGSVIYLSAATPGAFTATAPTAPDYAIKLGGVVKSAVDGIIFFSQVRGGEGLNNLHDVLITAPSASDTLTYDSVDTRWENTPTGNLTATSPILLDQTRQVIGGAAVVSLDSAYMPRERLSANRTYYVRTDGDDSNTGLVNTAGGAFLTIQHAVDIYQTLDCNGYDITIQIADGTYTTPTTISYRIGAGNLYILGNLVTPANVLIASTGHGIVVSGHPTSSKVYIRGVKFQANGIGLVVDYSSVVYYGNVNFGACGIYHLSAVRDGKIFFDQNYTISGSAIVHFGMDREGIISTGASITVTLTGTPAFAGAFVLATMLGIMFENNSITFSGSATGPKYNANLNSIIQTNGAGINHFPGNSAGTTATGGQYV